MAQTRSSEAPKVPRDRWVQLLHRRPVRWDVMLHKLAESLVRRYWYTQVHFRQPMFRLTGEELWDCSIHAARAFGREMSYAGVAHLAGESKVSIFTMDKPGAMDQIVAGGIDLIRAVITNYLEIAHHCFVKRNHPDLELLMPRISEALRRFLADKCSPTGELRPCIEHPLGDDEGYFPPGELAADPDTPSGNAALDAYRLNVLVHDADDADTVKRKLVEFVKTDPFLAPEFAVSLVTQLARQQADGQGRNRTADQRAMVARIRDRFVFSPSRQGGASPVEIFARRQMLASQRQKDRLERWITQQTAGTFRVIGHTRENVLVRDICSGRELEVVIDPAFADAAQGMPVHMRVYPWDDQWRICGDIHMVEGSGKRSGEDDGPMRRLLHPLRTRRRADEDDQRLLAARELVKWTHGRFVSRFGGEIARFDSMGQCGEAMAEFHHWLMIEAKLEDGRQFADAWSRGVELDFPAFDEKAFEASESDIASVGVVCDARHGMAILPDASAVELAMTSPFPSAQQKDSFTRLLMEQWRPGWLVEKIVRGHEERSQEFIREFLGDPRFDVDRDLSPLLGRLKCPDHTLPDRPVPFVAG